MKYGTLEYWKKRCELAEAYANHFDCDQSPDSRPSQYAWSDFIKLYDPPKPEWVFPTKFEQTVLQMIAHYRKMEIDQKDAGIVAFNEFAIGNKGMPIKLYESILDAIVNLEAEIKFVG